MDHSPSSSRTDRKTIERNRRNQMKFLYSKLNSLVPHQNSREVTSLTDQLDGAANYIKKLQTSLEKMKEKKDRLMGIERSSTNNAGGMMISSNSTSICGGVAVGVKSPQIEIHIMGSALEIVLITGLDFQFMFNETIRVLHEEGADIVNASFSVVEDSVFHTIHSKIGVSAVGPGAAARISERLNKFIDEASGSSRHI